MGETDGMKQRLAQLGAERISIEGRLTERPGEPDEETLEQFGREYARLQHQLVQLFRDAPEQEDRIAIMLELIRVLENRLVYLQNFATDATSDSPMLASLVGRFLDEMGHGGAVLTPLESTYYRGIVALYAGDIEKARVCFQGACESEESDEANDIKYKSYVILGNILHEERDYAGARELHEKSLRYSGNDNVSAQALAFKALNSYALKDYDEALSLFRQALELFRPDQPFFNSYFHRNALLFCGAINLLRKNYSQAEEYYRTAVAHVEPNSYDQFDALSQLGKICYTTGRWDDAVGYFNRAIEKHHFTENEHLVDTCFWLARTYVRKNEPEEARKLLERVTSSEVNYEKKSQAAELLATVR